MAEQFVRQTARRDRSRGRPRNLIAMSQLRHDPLSGRDVIVATGRAARPTTFAAIDRRPRRRRASARSVPGNEPKTPPEVARTGGGEPDAPGWQVRAFPNLYPIVEAHEVVVLSPDHRSFAELDDDEAVEVFTLLRDRVHAHLEAGHVYGVAIINHLKAAGASIAHPHAQVFALDVVPHAVDEAVARVRDAGVDLVHADARRRASSSSRRTDGVTVVVPARRRRRRTCSASRTTTPGARFDLADDAVLAAIAVAHARRAAHACATALGDVPYNLVVHTAPAPADVPTSRSTGTSRCSRGCRSRPASSRRPASS